MGAESYKCMSCLKRNLFPLVLILLFFAGCSSEEFLSLHSKTDIVKTRLLLRPISYYQFGSCIVPYQEFLVEVKSFTLLSEDKSIVAAVPIGGNMPLINNLSYPELAKRAGVEGIVEVLMEVTKKGYPQNVKIIRGIGGGCDEAVLRAIGYTIYQPALLHKKKITTKYKLEIYFHFPAGIKQEIEYRTFEFSNGRYLFIDEIRAKTDFIDLF